MTARHSPATRDVLRLAHVELQTDVLGPDTRAAIYVQGCHLRCRGCTAEDWLDFDGGEDVAVDALLGRLLDAGVRAITISGGEPTMQPRPLVALIDALAAALPDLSVMVYTGYRLEHLLATGTAEQHELLARVDILVDSPYVERWHGNLKWRGSSNQRVLRLTDRHAIDELLPDASAGLEFVVGPDLRVHQIGVPYRPATGAPASPSTSMGDAR